MSAAWPNYFHRSLNFVFLLCSALLLCTGYCTLICSRNLDDVAKFYSKGHLERRSSSHHTISYTQTWGFQYASWTFRPDHRHGLNDESTNVTLIFDTKLTSSLDLISRTSYSRCSWDFPRDQRSLLIGWTWTHLLLDSPISKFEDCRLGCSAGQK